MGFVCAKWLEAVCLIQSAAPPSCVYGEARRVEQSSPFAGAISPK